MDNTELKNLLMDIPMKLCRNMKDTFIKSILKDLNMDLSVQHYMILKLLEGNKNLYVTEFVSVLNITKPQMTLLIDRLINMKYVKRVNDHIDRRKIYISLTGEGENVLTKINKRVNEQIDSRIGVLSQSELDVLENGLQILQKLCLNCN
ncbi:MAG: MarR family transcriptional regulator [Bacteroidales bacterium]|nr:MarR family transcriptional regulator [Bacteroidales bacterium]